jgi:alpha-tubulin suppressor-like RCC1 family protein
MANPPPNTISRPRRRALRILALLFLALTLPVLLLLNSLFRPTVSHLTTTRPLPPGRVTPKLSANSDVAALIAPDGSLWAWGGTDSKLHFVTGKAAPSETPVRIGSDSDWSRIVFGDLHVLALKTNGTLWGWGTNHHGQLGRATNINFIPQPTQLAPGTSWVQVAAGQLHSLALRSDGTLWSCGQNIAGQIGDGTTTDRHVLAPVNNDRDWKQIAAGLGNSFAIKTNGTLWSWGSNPTPATNDYLLPIQIDSATNWAHVTSAAFVFCALKSNGTLWIGGHNAKSLGVAYGAVAGKLTQLGPDTGWEEVHLGEGYLIGRKKDGSWWISGDNSWGELGIGASHGIIKRQWLYRPEKLPFDIDPWSFAVSGNTPATLVLTRDGTLWAWGARLGAPRPSQRFREWKFVFNRTLYGLSGEKFNGFSAQYEAIQAFPRKLWELPPETRPPLD